MAACACSPLQQSASQRPVYGGYMEVPGVPEPPERPCLSSPKGPPFCPPEVPPCYSPPKQGPCPPMMQLRNAIQNRNCQSKLEDPSHSPSFPLSQTTRMLGRTDYSQPATQNVNNYIPSPCACPDNLLPKDPPPAKKPLTYKGMPTYCRYLEKQTAVEEPAVPQRELLHTSQFNVEKYCPKKPCSCIPLLPERISAHQVQKSEQCPCDYKNESQNSTTRYNVQSQSQIMGTGDKQDVQSGLQAQPCAPGCRTQGSDECAGINGKSQGQITADTCVPNFGSEEWGVQSKNRPHIVNLEGKTQSQNGTRPWRTCLEECPGYLKPELKPQAPTGLTTRPGYEECPVRRGGDKEALVLVPESHKEAPKHQHCTVIDRELPAKYPEALCYCPIDRYKKSTTKTMKPCSHNKTDCKCLNFTPHRDALKDTERSKRCPKGKIDCTCPESELKELDPCTGDPKQVEREKPQAPAPAVSGPSCYLPQDDPQDKFGGPQMQVHDGVTCHCPGLSPHTQGPEFIPQPENRPVEALAACEPPPCVCDVPPCQEPPQKGAPCYLPELRDKFPPLEATTAEGQESGKMGVIGPWATGRVDWGPLAGLTGTRPVVDRYSITRYSEGEWRKHNCDVLIGADKETHHAKVVDFNGRQCASFTAADTDKKQNENTKRLSQRAHDVHRWKVELEHAINAMADEINTLELQRQRLKTAMGVLRMPESIAGECLDRRTARLEPDLVRDRAEEELIKEAALISEIRDLMGRMLKQMEEQLAHNKAIKQRLEMDWSDKKEAYEIEATNVGLRNTSRTLLFKPGATRFPDGQSTPESWEHYTKENLTLLEAERNRSVELRHFLNSFMNDMARDLRMQADRVDTALAMRIAETDEARQRLENELLKTLRRIADTEKLIADMKQAIRNQDAAMKKAQTRLDNRLLRPRQENCRDIPQYGLVDEVKSIAESVSALKAQLQQAEESLYGLMTTRGDLEREIIVKRKTLFIDRDRCQEIRSHYPSSVALTGH